MDDYKSEKEQLEELGQWWRENRWFLLGGAGLALIGVFGYQQYQAYRTGQSETAAALYQSLREAANGSDSARARPLLEQLEAQFPTHAYTQQARLLMARTELVSAPDRAAEELREVMMTSTDPELAMIARLRLARVLAYREQYAEALALLDVASPGQFAGRINEIKGDIYVAQGRIDDARGAYLSAMVSPGAELLDRSFLQMKLGDLSSDTVAATRPTPDPVPEAAPDAVPEESAEPPTPAAAPDAAGDGA